MTDPVIPASGETPAPEVEAGAGATETPTPTVAEVEAQWANRMSQRDKAHAAETETLRRELASRDAAVEAQRRTEEQARLANMSEAQRLQEENTILTQRLEQERTQRVIDTRKARFPGIAAELGDDVLAAMDEGRLAALETRFAQPAPPTPSLIDPNSAARTAPAQPVPPMEKTIEQLKADLEREAPEFIKTLA